MADSNRGSPARVFDFTPPPPLQTPGTTPTNVPSSSRSFSTPTSAPSTASRPYNRNAAEYGNFFRYTCDAVTQNNAKPSVNIFHFDFSNQREAANYTVTFKEFQKDGKGKKGGGTTKTVTSIAINREGDATASGPSCTTGARSQCPFN